MNIISSVNRCSNRTYCGFCEVFEEHMRLPVDDDGYCQCILNPNMCEIYSPSTLKYYDIISTRIPI